MWAETLIWFRCANELSIVLLLGCEKAPHDDGAPMGRLVARSGCLCLEVWRLRQLQDVVGRLLCSRACYQDRPLVGAQHLEPVIEVCRVLKLAVDPAVRAQER